MFAVCICLGIPKKNIEAKKPHLLGSAEITGEHPRVGRYRLGLEVTVPSTGVSPVGGA